MHGLRRSGSPHLGLVLRRWKRHAGYRLDPDQMIMHGAHAGDIFGGDDASLPLAFVGDGAPQFGDGSLTTTLTCGAQGCLAKAATMSSRIAESPPAGASSVGARLTSARIRLARLTMPTILPSRITGKRLTRRRSISSTTVSKSSSSRTVTGSRSHDVFHLAAGGADIVLRHAGRGRARIQAIAAAAVRCRFRCGGENRLRSPCRPDCPSASTTGRPLTRLRSIVRAASRIVACAATEMTFAVMTSRTRMASSAQAISLFRSFDRSSRSASSSDQQFKRDSAERFRSTMRREVGTSIVAELSRPVSVRETVSMVRPR